MIRRLYSLISYTMLAVNAMPFTLSDKDKESIQRLLKERKHPWQVLKRLEAIRLLSQGLSQNIIAKQLCVRREIIYEYKRAFLAGGMAGLIRMEKPGKETKLTEEMLQHLEAYRDSHRKRLSHKELSDWLFEQYKVTISPEWLAKRLAMRQEAKKTEPWK